VTRRKFRECDVCGDKIDEECGHLALVLKRSLFGRLRVGLRKYVCPARDTPDWRRTRFDLCTYCREQVVREVKKRATDS